MADPTSALPLLMSQFGQKPPSGLPPLQGPDMSPLEKLGIVSLGFLPPPFAIAGMLDSLGKSANETNPQPQPYGQPLEGAINPEGELTNPGIAEQIRNALINSRNTLYHSTKQWSIPHILESGQINPSSYVDSSANGVSMSRIPTIEPKSSPTGPDAVFKIDPNAIGSTRPIAEPGGWQKTLGISNLSYVDAMNPDELNNYKQLEKDWLTTSKEYNNLLLTSKQTDDVVANKAALIIKLQSIGSDMGDLQNNAILRAKNQAPMNPNFEFEQRTQGQPINLQNVKELLLNPNNIKSTNNILDQAKAAGIPVRIANKQQMQLDRVQPDQIKAALRSTFGDWIDQRLNSIKSSLQQMNPQMMSSSQGIGDQ